jgi:hypothetical protein
MDRLGSLEVPETEDELRLLLNSGRLGERNAIDLKRELGPSAKGNLELARDLASLAAQGGLLIVGVDEGPPASLALTALSGLKERIANVARDGVRPSLRIDVREIPSQSSRTDGYVVAIIPASPDRPHEADGSYWGRSGAGKVKLRHEEVERYRSERTVTRSTIEAILDDWVARDPTPPAVRQNAHLFVVAEPVLGIPEMVDAKVGARWQRWLHERVANALVGGAAWSPDIAQAFAAVATVDGYALRDGAIAADGTVADGAYESGLIELRLTLNGGVRIFAARASDTSSRGKTAVEGVIVGLAYRAAQAAGVISQECDFRGDWDFALGITGLRGAFSSEAIHDVRFAMVAGPYPEDAYRASTRATAGEVAGAQLDIATRLTDRLNRVLNDRRFVFGKRG